MNSRTIRKLLAGVAMRAAAAPVIVGLMNAPAMRAQSQAPAATPRFEVAAIKPCKETPAGRSGGVSASPGRLNSNCGTVMALIRIAYIDMADGHVNPPQSIPIEGGPAWIDSDLYEINAKADGNASREMMSGPMLQALLEDRFKLKIRRETREVPVYALTVAKGGPKLHPFKEGSCVTEQRRAQFVAAGRPIPESCADFFRQGPGTVAEFHGMSLDQISTNLSRFLDRPIADKTGIAGRFDVRLEFAPGQATPGLRDPGSTVSAALSDPAGPSIFTAIQEQLGLKLEPTKAPRDFLVVDHIERPSEN